MATKNRNFSSEISKAYTIGSPAIPQRLAWVDTFLGLVTVTCEPDEYKFLTKSDTVYNDLVHHPDKVERGDEIILYLPMFEGSQRRFVALNLSRLNPDELKHVKHVIDMAFDAAKPVVEARLKDAEEAHERGELYYARMYRPESRVVIGQARPTPLEPLAPPEPLNEETGDEEDGKKEE